MEFKRNQGLGLLSILFVIVMVGMYLALLVLRPLDPKFSRFIDPANDPILEGYRIFFFSMQNVVILYLAFLILLLGSVAYLVTKKVKWDTIALSSAKLGIIFCSIVLVTGAIFSNLAWGAYWNWDPRQTTTLMLWFILAGYLFLRSILEDEENQAKISAVLGIFGFIGVPLTHYSARLWYSLHPRLGGIMGFQLDASGLGVFLLMLSGSLLLFAYLLWLDVKIISLERDYRIMRRSIGNSTRL